jgi:hypothetical protein
MTHMRLATLTAVLFAMSRVASGAAPTPEEAAAAGRAAVQQSEHPVTAAAGNIAAAETKTALPPSPTEVAMSDKDTKQAYLVSMQRFYEYRTNGYAFRSRVFEWQLFSSRVIFVIVVLLVLAGIYFAAIQFHVALSIAKRNTLAAARQAAEAASGPKAPPTDAPLSLAAELEISAKGVVVKSSVLGVLILTLSLAFFYLYLVYVYPINDTL